MPNKCCVLNCRTGYVGNDLDGVTQPQLFRLPSAKDDPERRVSLTLVLQEISDYYEFGMKEAHAKVFANILLNNYCKSLTPRDSKEAKMKIIKLS